MNDHIQKAKDTTKIIRVFISKHLAACESSQRKADLHILTNLTSLADNLDAYCVEDEALEYFLFNIYPNVIYSIKSIIYPDFIQDFPSPTLKNETVLLLNEIEQLTPVPIVFFASTRPKEQLRVHFSSCTSTNTKKPKSPLQSNQDPESALRREAALSVKRVMAKNELKIDPKVTPKINPRVAALIEKIATIEAAFDDKNLSLGEMQVTLLPNYISQLKKSIRKSRSEKFPDQTLKDHTEYLISKLKDITPPQCKLYPKSHPEALEKNCFIPVYERRVAKQPTTLINDDDFPCSLNPFRYIFG